MQGGVSLRDRMAIAVEELKASGGRLSKKVAADSAGETGVKNIGVDAENSAWGFVVIKV